MIDLELLLTSFYYFKRDVLAMVNVQFLIKSFCGKAIETNVTWLVSHWADNSADLLYSETYL